MSNFNSSVLGRLLSELSWEGSKINRYRNGGRGYENVLTAEVLQALDFLPRTHFLGAIIDVLNMNNEELRIKLRKEVENSKFTLLPGNYYLRPSEKSHQTGIAVQPDAILESSSIYTLIEAKRIKSSSFQKEQLAREFVLVTRQAGERMPLLVLILGKEPPVRVSGLGKKTIEESILIYLKDVLDKTENHPLNLDSLTDMIDSNIAWITWDSIEKVIVNQLKTFDVSSQSVQGSVTRLCNAITESICRHR